MISTLFARFVAFPLVAECLRTLEVPTTAEDGVYPSADVLQNLTDEWENVTKQNKSIVKPAPCKYTRDEMVVQYNQTETEEGTQANFFWDAVCSAPNQTGVCTFKKNGGSNPPRVHIQLKEKANESASFFRLTTMIRVMGIVTKRDVKCAACDSQCRFGLPLAGDAVMRTPICPLPTEFNITMPDMDFGRVPSFVRAYALTTISMSRDKAGEQQVLRFTLDTWV
mmetsp:Transcript_29306/g.68127  ORF Transcript_29306/g.68127 Transcript_29306/m.68127 type:complete len:224 (-) Transcript_29306:59-730(-)